MKNTDMIVIEITGATKEQLSHVYSKLNAVSFNGFNCEWRQAVEGKVVTIVIDSDTIRHSDFMEFIDRLIDLGVEWEELEAV